MPARYPYRIGFMHIPKTAGVSVADAFVRELGTHQCALFSNEISDEIFTAKRFVSGHVYFGDITRNAFLFTFLRDPIKQIASHLMWIDHYNLPEFQHEIVGFSKNIQMCIRRLAHIDLSNGESINEYLTWLPIDSELRIINVQSEMLAFKRKEVIRMTNKELGNLAIRHLHELDFFGLNEDFVDDMRTLFRLLDFESEPVVSLLNRSPSARNVDYQSSGIRRVLSKYVEADQRLYDHALEAKGKRLGAGSRLFARIKGIYGIS